MGLVSSNLVGLDAMDVQWPLLDPALIAYFERVFVTPFQLQAAFDDSESCVELLRAGFPDAVDEVLANTAAILVVWQQDHAHAFKRMRRSMAESSLYRLPRAQEFDVRHSYDKLSKTSFGFLLELNAKKKQQKYREEPPDARAQRFNAERKKYITLLANLIKEADLPVVQVIAALDDTGLAWQHLFAARRAGTLKNRYKAWRPFRTWIELNRGYVFPRSLKDIIDYMQHRVSEGCGKTIPVSFDIALQLFETVGRIPEDERLSRDPLWQGHIKSWEAELSADAPPQQTAPMLTIAMLISLELVVVDEGEPLYKRALSWAYLVMVWGALRCDDLQSILPSRTTLSNFGLKLILGKSKTTGPDKPHKEVAVHVLRTVSLTGMDWLGCGFTLWEMEPFAYKRDYMVMLPNDDWTGPRRKFATPATVSALMCKLLSQLYVPRHVMDGWEAKGPLLLLPDGLASFFTGHTPRNFLASVAAVLGYSKDMRAYLGRWTMGMSASEEYIRTSRQVVYKIQKSVNRSIVEGREEQYFEDEAIDALCEAAERSGANPNRIRKRHTVMNNLYGRHCIGGLYPTMAVQDDDWFLLQNPEADDDQLLEERVQTTKVPVHDDEKEKDHQYFVTISRRTGHRRLHLMGCFVKPSNCSEVRLFNQVSNEDFDSTCRSCKRKMLDRLGKVAQDDSSSTASSSSTDGPGPEAEENM